MGNQISLQTSEIESFISSFQNLSSKVNFEVSEKLQNGFKGLVECDLFIDGLKIITENSNQVSEVLTSISTNISEHLNNVRGMEDEYSNRVRSGGSSSSQYVENAINNTSIIEQFSINLQRTDPNSLSNLVHNFNVLKDKLALDDILFDSKNNAEFINILKSQLGFDGEFSDEEIKEIRKILINKLFETELENEELKTDTIYMLKTYLVEFAKENNITVGDLLVEPKYKGILNIYLQKISEGEIKNVETTPEEMEKIKAYISKKMLVKQKEGGPDGNILYG